jgi:hypothetical protein
VRAAVVAALVAALVAACSDGGGGAANNAADGAGTCQVRIEHHPSQGGMHVTPGTPITYSSNPPSSGQHYGTWVKWAKAYTIPIERGYYVHNLEHAGVVLLYHCTSDCTDVVASLDAIGRGLPKDSRCADGINARWILTPDNLLDPGVKVAAAAWEWTWEASCVDEPSLRAFLSDHYGDGPEDLCNDGQDFQP